MVRVVDCHAGVLGSNLGGPKDFPLGITSYVPLQILHALKPSWDSFDLKVSKGAKIRNRYKQVPLGILAKKANTCIKKKTHDQSIT